MTSSPSRPGSPIPASPPATPWAAGIRSSSPLRPWPATKLRPWPLLHSLSLPLLPSSPSTPTTTMPTALTLRRGAYTGPTGRSAALNNALSVPALLLILASLPANVLRYLFTRPRGFTLKTFIIFRVLRYLSLLVPVLPPPETRAARWAVPSTAGRRPALKVEVVTAAPALASWRVHYAAGPAKAIDMPGFLLTPSGVASGPARPDERIVLYIHGGAYIRGHPLWTAFPHRLAAETGHRVYCAQYRKSLTDDTAFPAPLLDALAAWAHVTGMGFSAAQIVVTGDSAGAHLALALVTQLHALGQPLPGGLALISPWVDFTCGFPSWERHTLDYLTKDKLRKAIASATRHYADEEKRGAFFSPALAEDGHWRFLRDTPVFVTYGGIEVFSDEDKALVEGMRASGVTVKVWKDEHGVHDTPIIDCVVPTKTQAFAHYRDGVLDILHTEVAGPNAADAEKEKGDDRNQVPLSPYKAESESSGVLVDEADAASEREGEVEDHAE
ncbi:unnamed protein product [Cutaneotrichosporon oleaginosum]